MFIRSEIFFFPFASCLLAFCLAEGAGPTADGAGGGGGIATLIAGLARPTPWQQDGCNFHQRVLAEVFLALEKARTSVLREMSIHTFLSGNWKRHYNQCWERCQVAHLPRKLEKFRLDRFRAVDYYRGVDRYSESKLEPLQYCGMAVHYSGPRPYKGILDRLGPWTTIGYHTYQALCTPTHDWNVFLNDLPLLAWMKRSVL